MNVADKARKLSRDIIKTYVHHVRNKIKAGDEKYISSGLDTDLVIYENLFLEVLAVTLGASTKTLVFPHDLVMDCVGALDLMLVDSKYKSILTKYTPVVYDVCTLLFSKVEKGVREREGTL